ncbi:MAG: hypothetical protein LBS48_00695 [Treponema sp.]|jgi:hypothetical protein|nr:hypothetical protein [Treponema sp.]
MSESDDWRDLKYIEVFEQELRGLKRRWDSDPLCTIGDLEGILQNLYIMDGADWAGRGCVQDVAVAATIAAYEQFIAQWASGEGCSIKV